MTRHQLAQRLGWLLYLAALPLGLVQTAERWSRIGGPWLAEVASQAGIRTEAGYFFGAVAGGFLALTVPPLIGGVLGYALGYAIASAMQFVDHSEVELERLQQERAMEKKRQANAAQA